MELEKQLQEAGMRENDYAVCLWDAALPRKPVEIIQIFKGEDRYDDAVALAKSLNAQAPEAKTVLNTAEVIQATLNPLSRVIEPDYFVVDYRTTRLY